MHELKTSDRQAPLAVVVVVVVAVVANRKIGTMNSKNVSERDGCTYLTETVVVVVDDDDVAVVVAVAAVVVQIVL